ncbi:helix-turn-helix domain containing protein [Amycolatopsis cynarae]|uniref:Helix-turn-helix domain containing protein n=1 Tax=Amycolatopsis cynarae TaxID=2995223 RepID=A0ABY7B741_9PSEU|nr:TetR/AcrR family transcriptional regulator [Amycolatopsis sp. HUAS 11-8]WAL68140.1 helix-turn-helix domain containing protein [Amycolatopsis sp. HUAS 11-8]
MTAERPSGRDRILAAAEHLFAERGYARTSTARLAAAAEVPQGLIFYHFGTKEGLLLALIRERSTQTLADLVPAPPPADPRAAITELWARLCRLLGEQTPMHRIVFREGEHHPELQARAREIHDHITDTITAYLTGITGHPAPTARHRTAARMLVAASSANALTPDADPLVPGAVADLLLHGLT